MTLESDAAPMPTIAGGIVIRELDDVVDLEAASLVLSQVWNRPADSRQITVSMLRALSMTGNYVCAAFAGPRLVGAAVGFFAPDSGTLHSHIAGVSAEGRAHHVGFLLKTHQRTWALSHGLRAITWTFDPLVRRNAYFNLVKLGARATRYLPDFYGPMHDGLNLGETSDRLLIEWDLLSAAAVDAVAGRRPAPPTADHLPLITPGTAGLRTTPWSGGPALVPLPEDIEKVRLESPHLAQAWRAGVRDVLGGALDRGAEITGFDRDRGYLISSPTTDSQSGTR